MWLRTEKRTPDVRKNNCDLTRFSIARDGDYETTRAFVDLQAAIWPSSASKGEVFNCGFFFCGGAHQPSDRRVSH